MVILSATPAMVSIYQNQSKFFEYCFWRYSYLDIWKSFLYCIFYLFSDQEVLQKPIIRPATSLIFSVIMSKMCLQFINQLKIIFSLKNIYGKKKICKKGLHIDGQIIPILIIKSLNIFLKKIEFVFLLLSRRHKQEIKILLTPTKLLQGFIFI